MNIRLDESWRTALAPEFDKLYFSILTDRIRQAYQHEGPIYPPGGLI
ncbi:MAG: uracil-DNA glycosylase, partial [Porphyromonadaceae bacterium]|nr:uracil-DNA glycosylase [Porphyromonadaceae bacterium]